MVRWIAKWLSLVLSAGFHFHAGADDGRVSFNYDIRPIMSDTCFICHGPDEAAREADLRLDRPEDAYADRDGIAAIQPGDPEESLIMWMITAESEEELMPPPSHPRALTEHEKDLFRRWIEQGARYEKHWSLVPPQATPPERDSEAQWGSNPIDAFVRERLDEEALRASPRADKMTLLRRVTFDLTGLPPTLEEIDAFLADDRSGAFERVVDGLLGRVAYAERMTTEWMDVARFADSHGYSQDFIRDMSPWRDWVIDAFDSNMPYDQFVEWQLAGDLLQDATDTQKLATGFGRLHPQNAEGGIVNEEFRVEYVAERAQTVGAAFMGITMECARCHDHKYDPISQKNFYEMFSFFNNIDESGQISYEASDMPVPTLMLPTDTEEQQLAELDEQIEAKLEELDQLRLTRENEALQAWRESAELDVPFVAHFPFQASDSVEAIANAIDPEKSGKVMFCADPGAETGPALEFAAVDGREGIRLNGDDALYFPSVNFFRRALPFSVGLEAWIPEKAKEGVLFHFNKAGILYNYKGFEVSLREGYWEVRMAHTFPYNAIQLASKLPAARERWQSVLLTYDGSSQADGLTLFVDGEPIEMLVKRDRLYKNMLSNKEDVQKEIGLKVGARWRSRGLPDAVVDDLRVFDRKLTAWEASGLAGNRSPSIENGGDAFRDYFLNRHYEPYRTALKELASLRLARNELNERVQEVMVMDERHDLREAFVLRRGAYDAPGEPVSPDVPKAILPFGDDRPRNRLGLAKWLMDPENPLTARVTVNRYWQMMFGHGIVATPEDFGNQGSLPTHPELLDWLAHQFIDSGWDVKGLIKLIASSATYQQSSRADEELFKRDPENELLARGPSRRLTAEMLRDNALAASGLLVKKVGGKSVYPYQPPDLWKMNKGTYEEGSGEDLYRRSMYTIWKRTVPPPTMNNFDAPNRSYCVVKRQQTDTPLQALTLMNDPQFIEASRVLAERVMTMSGEMGDQLVTAYRLLASRAPSEKELGLLQELYEQLLSSFSSSPERAAKLLAVGQKPVNERLDRAGLASLATVASLIMNHDAAVVLR